MDTAWRFRFVLILTFAIIIFGDMLGYANVKGNKDSNGSHQRNVDATIKKNAQHHHNSPQNLEGIAFFLTNFLVLVIFFNLKMTISPLNNCLTEWTEAWHEINQSHFRKKKFYDSIEFQ